MSGVNNKTRRLVDNDDIVVGINDGQFDRGIGLRKLRLRQLRRVDLDHLVERDPNLARHCHDAVEASTTGSNEHCSICATGVGEQRNDAVESFASQCCGDFFSDHDALTFDENNAANTISAPPTLIAMSATLKMGNH